MKCQNCGEKIQKKPNAHNVKYCVRCRATIRKEQTKEAHKRYMEKKSLTATPEKLQCFFCGKYYKKPISHAWQTHGINKKEYKRALGIDQKHGLITPETKKLLQDYIKKNYKVVVKNNLLKHGKKTRYIKGDKRAGNYERSAETMQRLKQQSFIKLKLKP